MIKLQISANEKKFVSFLASTVVFLSAYGAISDGAALTLPLSVTESPINVSMIVSKPETCYAPCMVHFDTVGTTSNSVTAYPFHEVQYSWNFGDPQVGVTSTCGSLITANQQFWACGSLGGALNKNVAQGPIASHLYEDAGTYLVTTVYFDGANTISVGTPITVVAWPDNANTFCFSAAETPTPGTNNCPSGSTAHQAADACAAINTYSGTGKRLLFNRGETYSCNSPATISTTGPQLIGAYGIGALPIISTNQANGTILNIGDIAGTTVKDIRIIDLELTQNTGTHTKSVRSTSGGGMVDQITLLRLYIHDIGDGPFFGDSINVFGNNHFYDQLAVIDTLIETITGGSGTHGIDVFSTRFTLQGTYISDTIDSEHLARLDYLNRAVVSNNSFLNGALGKETLAIRGLQQNPSGSFYSNFVAPAPSPTQYVLVSNNSVDISNNPFGVEYKGAGAAGLNVLILDVLNERNYYYSNASTACSGSPCAQIAITTRANRHTIRNEIINADNWAGGTSPPLSIKAQSASADEPAASNLWLYNNTAYSSGIYSTPWFIWPGAGSSNIALKNNLAYFPNSTGNTAMCALCGGISGLVQSNNSTDATGSNQMKNTDPLFAGPMTTPAGYAVGGGSYALGGGASVPVWSDFFLTAEPNPRNIGAVN